MKDYTIERIEETSSTNTLLIEWAAEGAPEGLCVIAARQYGGRGRMGRSFHSPETGLYMSVLLRPKLDASTVQLITVAAAVAAARAIEHISSQSARIKWVNDILIDGRKVAGILTEAQFVSDTLNSAVLGLGVNLSPPAGGFPDEIANSAGALFPDPCPDSVRMALAVGILDGFFALYRALPDLKFIEEYRKRSSVVGHRINVLQNGGSRPALALDIDGRARLIVRYDDTGEVSALSMGEISIRNID